MVYHQDRGPIEKNEIKRGGESKGLCGTGVPLFLNLDGWFCGWFTCDDSLSFILFFNTLGMIYFKNLLNKFLNELEISTIFFWKRKNSPIKLDLKITYVI